MNSIRVWITAYSPLPPRALYYIVTSQNAETGARIISVVDVAAARWARCTASDIPFACAAAVLAIGSMAAGAEDGSTRIGSRSRRFRGVVPPCMSERRTEKGLLGFVQPSWVVCTISVFLVVFYYLLSSSPFRCLRGLSQFGRWVSLIH